MGTKINENLKSKSVTKSKWNRETRV